jgi:O-antigen/teichoic acid export membrane protein
LEELKGRRGAYLRMLSGGVAVQVLMSASNFVVGLLLIRRTTNSEYGYYVLVGTAVSLTTAIQGSFIQPPMILRLTGAARAVRSNVVGGLYRDQNRLVALVSIPIVALILLLFITGYLHFEPAAMLIAGTTAVMSALRREFFRMVLFAYRLPNLVLKGDFVYCLLLIGGAALSTLTPSPAAVAALTMALSAFVGRYVLSKAMWHREPWNRKAPFGMLREIFHQGSVSAFGAVVHWLFSQGYTYLVAATLNVSAVATLAATRLPVSPVGLLSNGIGTLMLPTVSGWTQNHVARTVLRRVTLFACAVAAATGSYLIAMWFSRDWIFVHVLKKTFDQRDLLLLIWSVNAVVTCFRDQLLYFLIARGRFHITSSITLVSAVASLTTSFTMMRHVGLIGAPVGILIGESLHVIGIIVFSLREANRDSRSAPMAA